jgi:anaerobic selenocysteine-containing dehydrogenase
MAIHPITAQETGIADGEWIYLETRTGKVRLKAKYNSALHPKVVTTVYGWWQACDEPKLPG